MGGRELTAHLCPPGHAPPGHARDVEAAQEPLLGWAGRCPLNCVTWGNPLSSRYYERRAHLSAQIHRETLDGHEDGLLAEANASAGANGP